VELSLSTRIEGGVAIITAAGDVDVYSAHLLREQISRLVDAGHIHLVLDLDGLEFLDSTGLGVLVGGLKRVRTRRGSIRIVCTREQVLKPFHITGLIKAFPVHPDLAEAVRTANDGRAADGQDPVPETPRGGATGEGSAT